MRLCLCAILSLVFAATGFAQDSNYVIAGNSAREESGYYSDSSSAPDLQPGKWVVEQAQPQGQPYQTSNSLPVYRPQLAKDNGISVFETRASNRVVESPQQRPGYVEVAQIQVPVLEPVSEPRETEKTAAPARALLPQVEQVRTNIQRQTQQQIPVMQVSQQVQPTADHSNSVVQQMAPDSAPSWIVDENVQWLGEESRPVHYNRTSAMFAQAANCCDEWKGHCECNPVDYKCECGGLIAGDLHCKTGNNPCIRCSNGNCSKRGCNRPSYGKRGCGAISSCGCRSNSTCGNTGSCGCKKRLAGRGLLNGIGQGRILDILGGEKRGGGLQCGNKRGCQSGTCGNGSCSSGSCAETNPTPCNDGQISASGCGCGNPTCGGNCGGKKERRALIQINFNRNSGTCNDAGCNDADCQTCR